MKMHSCGEPVGVGVRCPRCGERYEERVLTASEILSQWEHASILAARDEFERCDSDRVM